MTLPAARPDFKRHTRGKLARATVATVEFEPPGHPAGSLTGGPRRLVECPRPDLFVCPLCLLASFISFTLTVATATGKCSHGRRDGLRGPSAYDSSFGTYYRKPITEA